MKIAEAYLCNEHIRVLGMAEAGINITDVSRHFAIHKTTAYQTSIVSGKQGWLETVRNRTNRKKNLINVSLILHQGGRETLCWRPWDVSGKRRSPKTVRNRLGCSWRMVKILTICIFQSIFMIGIALNTNEIKFCCNDAYKIRYRIRYPLSNVTWHSGTWPYTMTPSIVQTLHLFANLLPNWTLIPILTLLPIFGGYIEHCNGCG